MGNGINDAPSLLVADVVRHPDDGESAAEPREHAADYQHALDRGQLDSRCRFRRSRRCSGSRPLPGKYSVCLAIATASYLALVEVVKRRVFAAHHVTS
jgi:hypothetical protein